MKMGDYNRKQEKLIDAQIKQLEREEEEQRRVLSEARREARNARREARNEKAQSLGYSSYISMQCYRAWVIIKWLFCVLWGGPFLIVKGLKTKSKLWFYVGIEFTLLFIVVAILSTVIPDFTTSEDPLLMALTFILGTLLIANIVALIVYVVKFNKNSE